jgi:hypothetical protein
VEDASPAKTATLHRLSLYLTVRLAGSTSITRPFSPDRHRAQLQQSGIPDGRVEAPAFALVAELTVVPEEVLVVLPLEPGDVVEPTVVFPDGPVAVVPLLSRTTLLPTSQHCLRSWPLDPPVVGDVP